jgi:hypothetical protein
MKKYCIQNKLGDFLTRTIADPSATAWHPDVSKAHGFDTEDEAKEVLATIDSGHGACVQPTIIFA